MAERKKDYFYFQAKKEKFAARSVFKLEEIDRKYKLFRKSNHVLDLGAAPGSWSQYVSRVVGEKGRVLGIDLSPIKITLPNAAFLVSDIRTINWESVFEEYQLKPPFDVVLSDMAPKTTGIRQQDTAQSFELCCMALEAALKYVRGHGHFVAKMFEGDEFGQFRKMIQPHFKNLDFIRPKSTRSESREIFFVATDRKVPSS